MKEVDNLKVMKTNFIVSILILILAFPILASGPMGGSGGDPMERPSWWQGDWPPKNWGEFESGWNKN
ncbi:MAG: hypothetical protein ACHQYQ_07050, partial [Bacteriovoracales bacterium]